MSVTRVSALLIAATFLGMAGCATVSGDDRSRLVDMPLASTHADISFTMTTGSRQRESCESDADCPTQADREAAIRFALQVRRVTGILQKGAEYLYPNLAQQVPGMLDGRFDVYVVEDTEPGSASSANGRVALSAALGVRQPYDDWMAFVIAREMGHVIARHHEENSAAGIATSVILNILIPGSGLLKSAISAGGSGVAARSKRDVQGIEADAIALDLLRASGFRLRDISLTLLIEPVLLDDGRWSESFRLSSSNFLAEVHRLEFNVVAAR